MSGEVFHAPFLRQHPGFVVRSVMQRDPGKPVRHEFNVVHSLDDLFNDDKIELIVVNTPNDTHFEYTKKALIAGKHVVVEKPFTVTTSEADELIALAEKYARVLTVFQNRRWDGDFMTVQSVVQQKLVGDLVEFEARYDRFRDHVEERSWKEQRSAGTGVLYNLGSHMIDQALVLFGMPRYVDARLGVQRRGGKADDFYDIRMEYEDLLVILKSSYLAKGPLPRYMLHGTQGSFVKWGIDPQEGDLKNGKMPGSDEWGKEDKQWWGRLNNHTGDAAFETIPGDYMKFYDNVYAAIRHGENLAVLPSQARDVIQIIEACPESERKGQAVRVDANV